MARVRKKKSKAAVAKKGAVLRAEKKRVQVAARRATAVATKCSAPRHVIVLAAGDASRAAASGCAAKLCQAGFVARVVRDGIVRALDEALVADALVVLFAADERELDDSAMDQITAIRSQGLPEVLAVHVDEPNKELRKFRARVLESMSLGETAALRGVDCMAAERKLKARKPSEIAWRARYGYLAVEEAHADGDTLSLVGWLRGVGMCANALVHVGGAGSFVCGRIVDVVTGEVLSQRNEDGDDPTECATPNPNAGEQTWIPEMEEGGDEFFAEDEKDDGEADATMQDEDDEGDGSEHPGLTMEMIENERKLEGEDNGEIEADDMEVDEDEARRLKETAETDEKFPDEVDTPMDRPARERFARYRGLKSFRTSTWDPKEQLPRDYATIFQFRDIRAARKRALLRAEEQARGDNFASPGRRVRLLLGSVPDDVKRRVSERVARGEAVVASSMLQHENKRSVVHLGVTRVGEDEEPIKAKARVTARVGFVSFDGRPMYSEHNANLDKHKMARYLVHGRYTVVSMYGPAVHHPAPALLFRHGEGGDRLLAAGSALGADPDRIVLKRIVLTGYPFKSQKRRAVVKFMFFQPDDVRWFRPVELWTKLGRVGNITEPMGTKGLMKCIFDSPLLHHDTVCMTLWKRVYPKL